MTNPRVSLAVADVSVLGRGPRCVRFETFFLSLGLLVIETRLAGSGLLAGWYHLLPRIGGVTADRPTHPPTPGGRRGPHPPIHPGPPPATDARRRERSRRTSASGNRRGVVDDGGVGVERVGSGAEPQRGAGQSPAKKKSRFYAPKCHFTPSFFSAPQAPARKFSRPSGSKRTHFSR